MAALFMTSSSSPWKLGIPLAMQKSSSSLALTDTDFERETHQNDLNGAQDTKIW